MPDTIRHILLSHTQKLHLFSDSARLDVERLLCHVLDVTPSHLYTWSEKILTTEEYTLFETLFTKRMNGEPIAYLIGKQGFWNLELCVNEDTLIPRPDTEVLIETILKRFKQCTKLDVLDLGTGSGAIALSLAHEKPDWAITAIDYCDKALAIAAQNKNAYNLSNVELILGSWYQPIANRQFDIIVSNPPYIDPSDPKLCPNVRQYEPTMALISKDNGLADIKHIIYQGKTHLKPNGFMILEHGFQQAQSVAEIFKSHGYQAIEHYTDLAGQTRATSAILYA
ncbi:peptide chain release factor N(5)-glutamine methyltransferase [Caedibacter taeniospiralis]|jgi:release factor glutamine methyltransferase|uniref:peptide chain release factor N(5)-glutamine methyltransferase n=1 Tax=Caedibacter taeniospiralis TaxID=28907 RepID=UPI0037C0E37F